MEAGVQFLEGGISRWVDQVHGVVDQATDLLGARAEMLASPHALGRKASRTNPNLRLYRCQHLEKRSMTYTTWTLKGP